MSIKVLLADDHRIMREGLRSLIEKEPGMEVVGEVVNGRDAVRQAKKLAPDVVVMDVALPELNGIDATRQIAAEAPGVRVVALSMHITRQFVEEMLSAGAAAYLTKDCAFEELARAITSVVQGQIYLSPNAAAIVVENYRNNHAAPAHPRAFSVLTPREREVLQLIAEGKNSKEIAARLHLSVKTVETHRRNIMRKLKINSVAGLTKYAIREGLITL